MKKTTSKESLLTYSTYICILSIIFIFAVSLFSLGCGNCDHHYDEKIYRVDFDLMGGSMEGNSYIKLSENAEPIELPIPTKEGYTFDGWYRTENYNQKVVSIPAANVTLYAKWNLKVYTITYELKGGSHSGNPTEYTIESEKIELNDATKEGAEFFGWTPANNIPSGSTGDKVFTAEWDPYYNVTFDSTGGTEVAPIIDALQDTLITEPTEPTMKEHKFLGWYTSKSGGSKWDFSTDTANGDMILFAQWELNRYTVTMHPENGEDALVKDYPYGSKIAEYSPTRIGYQLGHWYKNKSCDASARWNFGSDVITKNTSLYAGWNLIIYNINYILNNGHQSNNPTYYTVQDEIKLNTPTRRGYDFSHWEPSGHIVKGSTGDKTVTAHWNIKNYHIIYDLNGGTHAGNPSSYNINSPTIILNEPTRESYNFTGWQEGEGKIAAGSTGDKTFTAQWGAITHTVSFNSNEGSEVSPYTNVENNALINPPAEPTRSGYEFERWCTDDTLDFAWNFENDRVTSDITLVASWNLAIYDITYDLAGGSFGPDDDNPTSYNINSPTITLSEPTRENYNFIGWEEGEGKIETGSTGHKTFTAQWEEITHTVSFNSNGGSDVSPYTNVANNALINAPTEPTRSGYEFEYWYTDEGPDFPWDFANNRVTSDTTLAACWELVRYNITYNLNDGTHSGNPSSYDIESGEIILADPTRENYNFIGWEEGEGKIEAGSTGHKTFTAKWEARE